MCAFRMAEGMSQTIPQSAETSADGEGSSAPRVHVLLSQIDGSDLEAAVSVVRRQAFEPAPSIVVVGDGDVPDGLEQVEDLETAISQAPKDCEYLWLLHSDARPRPDALGALVAEAARNDASVAGSKLLRAGTSDELESVGGATDVFGEPYSGLDLGEIDLQQYDVVREVAFVSSASMLVRRDLAQGLRGLDPLLPPVAAGLDFSQRARLAGGSVISVPSSEVYHQEHCSAGEPGWREQAGRLRAMVTAYSPLTLLWVLPYDFLVSIADSLANLVLLRWRPIGAHLLSWLWNALHLPSTLRQRRRLRAVRSRGDEELFRFHARGSVRLRAVSEELTGRLLSLFDDDQALARGTRRIWSSPGIWGAVVALLLAGFASRGIALSGVPEVGFSMPFEPPSVALSRWWGGWNDAGLGSSSAVHPSVGLSAALSGLWFGLEGAARTVATLAAAILSVVGMGRLGGRLGLHGPGRYLAGLVLIGGPLVAHLTAFGSWTVLMTAAIAPWLVRATLVRDRSDQPGLARYGSVLVLGTLAGLASPLVVGLPLLVFATLRVAGLRRPHVGLPIAALAGGVAGAAFVFDDPGWVTDPGRGLGLNYDVVVPLLIAAGLIHAVVASKKERRVALAGAALGSAGLILSRLVDLPPGVEETVAISTSMGAALVVASAMDRLSPNPWKLASLLGATGLLLVSLTSLANGRLGLPAGDINQDLSFAETLADGVSGRLLVVATERDSLPGESRSGPGFWYRLVDGDGTTHDELWLPPEELGDRRLELALTSVAGGGELRPGSLLSEFGIDWIVLLGGSSILDEVLAAQLDLVPTPLGEASRIFENPLAFPVAGSSKGDWTKQGAAYTGSPAATVDLALNRDQGWDPLIADSSWDMTVAGEAGVVAYRGAFPLLQLLAVLVLVSGLALVTVERFRR